MRRDARGWAARATRTFRDFITPVLRLICSITSDGKLRSFTAARARSAVRADSAPSKLGEARPGADSGEHGDSIAFSFSEFIRHCLSEGVSALTICLGAPSGAL